MLSFFKNFEIVALSICYNMAMQFEYDEEGGTFFYFLLSFWGLVIIPATYYLWPRKKNDGNMFLFLSACSNHDVHVLLSYVFDTHRTWNVGLLCLSITYIWHVSIFFMQTPPFQKVLVDMHETETESHLYLYEYRHGMCFRGIHFILISTAHALFLTCLPVSIYGT